jgi:DNA topoisomerase-1
MSRASSVGRGREADAVAPPGLEYVDDGTPGYRRRRCGRGFVFLTPDGRPVRDPAVIDRLRSLTVPPAWTDVWFCLDERGHIQATGRDAKGRKQYRYHDDWQRARDEAKFGSLVDFGHALPALRERVADDMCRRDLSFERVVATTVWLLDRTLIRVGNHEYASDSYGLTTLLDDHAEFDGDTLRFRFVGKSGKLHDVRLRDRRVARIVRQCQELPGQQLLQYLADGVVRGVGSRDVNEYLRDATRSTFTAKTFRTWGASALTLDLLHERGPAVDERAALVDIRATIKVTAGRLHNTPTVCRASYVHPRVLDAHVDGSLHTLQVRRRASDEMLTDREMRLLRVLEADA